MRPTYHPQRRRVALGVAGLVVGLGLAAFVVIGVVIALGGGGGPRSRPSSAPPTTVPAAAASGLVATPPATVAASQSPVQVSTDAQIAAESAAASATNDAVAALDTPAPAVYGGWPRLAVATTPESWATSFVAGLLDVNYRDQSRAALGAWLMAESAPNLLPGVPTTVAAKTLYATVVGPDASGLPLPSAATWAAYARTGVVQQVGNLLVQADPDWSQLVGTGWQPPDARMDGIDVSGTLTVSRGTSRTVTTFSLEVTTGSAAWHPGYGTVALAGWKSP